MAKSNKATGAFWAIVLVVVGISALGGNKSTTPGAKPAEAAVLTPEQTAAKAAEDKRLADEEAAQQARKADDERAEKERCSRDLQCLSGKHDVAAAVYCKRPIEDMAKYDYKWTDGWTEAKFPRIRWVNQSRGIVGYVGDKIMFQNGFGAFQKMRYQCDFDTTTDKVVDVHVYGQDD